MKKVKNALVIMTDQHRVDTIGALGNPHAQTPNLDKLACDGFAATSAYTPTAICTPARASLMTGKNPFKHRVLANHEWNIGYQADLTPDQWTYTQELRDHGYNVGIVGKYHAGENYLPDSFGMDDDSMIGAINPILNDRYQKWLKDNDLPAVRIEDEWKGTLPGGKPGHTIAARLKQPVEATFERFLTELTIQRLREYAKEYKDTGKPFSLDVHYFGPHLPYIIPDEFFDLIDPDLVELPPSFAETFANKPPIQENYATYWSTSSFTNEEWRKLIAVYWGYVAMIDQEIGIILDELENLGLRDETAVFFTADHGEFTGAHRMNDKGPAMYEDIYNVPFFAHIPGIDRSGQTAEFVSILDIPATILDLAGLDSSKVEDGRSLLDLVQLERGEELEPWRDDIILEFHGHHFPLQQRALRTRDYKLIFSPESCSELYDLNRDPHELNNVYDTPVYSDVRRELETELYRRLIARGDTVFAKWMGAMADIDVDLGSTANSDYDVALDRA